MDMPKVSNCGMEKCSYNSQGRCHAMAINVGGAEGAMCDTFAETSAKCVSNGGSGKVGACRMIGCEFNDCLECMAPSVEITKSNNHPFCLTFKSR